MRNHNIYYLRPQGEHQCEIVKSKTNESHAQRNLYSFHSYLSEGVDYKQCFSQCSSESLNSQRNLNDDSIGYAQQLDVQVLSEQAADKFTFKYNTYEDWLQQFKVNSLQVTQFFKPHILQTLIEQSEQPTIREMIVLTLDYFTNLPTLVFYLLWKSIHNEQQQDMITYVNCQQTIMDFLNDILKYRINQMRKECGLLGLIEGLFPNTLQRGLLAECQIPLTPLRLEVSVISHQCLVLPWTAVEVAQALSVVNQAFFAEMQLHHIIRKGQLDRYFRRINALSFFVIYSVVRQPNKQGRQEAISYWVDVAQQLQIQEDMEGLFVVYKMGLERLLKEYIDGMPLTFRDEGMIRQINQFYETRLQSTKTTGIPSFHPYWIGLKKLETQVKGDLSVLDAIKDKLSALVEISQRQLHQQRQMRADRKVYLPSQQKYTFTELQIQKHMIQGVEAELETHFQIPVQKSALLQIELLKIAKRKL